MPLVSSSFDVGNCLAIVKLSLITHISTRPLVLKGCWLKGGGVTKGTLGCYPIPHFLCKSWSRFANPTCKNIFDTQSIQFNGQHAVTMNYVAMLEWLATRLGVKGSTWGWVGLTFLISLCSRPHMLIEQHFGSLSTFGHTHILFWHIAISPLDIF